MKFAEIMDRRQALARDPILSIPPGSLAGIVEKIRERTPTSGLLFERAARVIPGGHQHILAMKKPYPLTIRRALGCCLWDADDNRYLDYLMMAGPILLGHNYPPLLEAVIRAVREEGIGSGWTSEWEIRAAELICRHFPSVEKVRYFQSGTEADMAAARLARACTGKKKIIRIGGAYHGWSSEFTYDMHIPHSGPFQCAGIPEEFFSQLVTVGPNDPEALEQAFQKNREQGGTAALILEALGGESGAMPVHPDFNRWARELCDRHGALLIMDEVVTGFRLAMGGAQEYFGVRADLTVLGKVLTHGFPSSGALGGRADIMDCLAGVDPGRPKPFVAGTMAANVISTCATCWTLRFLEEERAIERANRAAEKLTDGLNGLFAGLGFPFFAYRYGSIIHFETAAPLAVDIRRPGGLESALARKEAVDRLGLALLSEGVVTKYGNRAFTCMAHEDADLERTLEIFERVLGWVPR